MDNEDKQPRSDDSLLSMSIASIFALFLKHHRLLYRPYVSVNPDSVPGGYRVRVIGQMPNTDGDLVGKIRIEVYVPSDPGLNIYVYIDWNRDIFGFWYREKIDLERQEDGSVLMADEMREVMNKIRKTSNGSVRIKSMNLGQHKIKRNKVKDAVFENGMKLL